MLGLPGTLGLWSRLLRSQGLESRGWDSPQVTVLPLLLFWYLQFSRLEWWTGGYSGLDSLKWPPFFRTLCRGLILWNGQLSLCTLCATRKGITNTTKVYCLLPLEWSTYSCAILRPAEPHLGWLVVVPDAGVEVPAGPAEVPWVPSPLFWSH